MVNYQNSKIYELICSETGLKYIGSTTRPLSQRLGKHKQKKNTCSSKILINPKIYLLENTPCNSKEELHAIERKYIENNECVNIFIPGRTQKEYKEENKEKIEKYNEEWKKNNKNYSKEYYLNNQEKKKEYVKKYRETNKEKLKEKINCECGSKYVKHNKTRHEKTQKHLSFYNKFVE